MTTTRIRPAAVILTPAAEARVADLMAQRGESVPLVLDDALVFCDDARFDRMLKLLRRGASRHQILVLTCHEREFLRAGAPVIRLADCRDAA